MLFLKSYETPIDKLDKVDNLNATGKSALHYPEYDINTSNCESY